MYDRAARGADSERTMARIWRITLDHLVATTPLAADLLRVLAWWAPEAIPRPLLAPLASPAQLATALGDLAAYNMIGLDADTITVHRLVQAVARTPDPRQVGDGGDPHRRADDIDHARGHATHLLNQTCPPDSRDPAQWPTWRTLLPHIDALVDHTDPATDNATTSHLLSHTACFLQDQGGLRHAINYYERALTTGLRLHGPDHADTLGFRGNLAYAYESAGDLGRAIPLHEQTLAGFERAVATRRRPRAARQGRHDPPACLRGGRRPGRRERPASESLAPAASMRRIS